MVCVSNSNSFHIQAKNMRALVCASVELLSDDSWTENSKSTDVNVGHWATLSYCLSGQSKINKHHFIASVSVAYLYT